MKKLLFLSSLQLLSSLALADDTEIYGTDGTDDDQRVNANVMFIMDTSGSMDGVVRMSNGSYDPSVTYNRNGDNSNPLYSADKFYHDLNSYSGDGHFTTTLSTGDSTNCTEHKTNLTTEGRSEGNFKQDTYWGWYNLNNWRNDSDSDSVTCDRGSKKWIYSGNYMNWYHNYQEEIVTDRLSVVVNVVKDLTESLSNVNLGLMRFDDRGSLRQGGMVDIAIDDVATTGPLISAKLDTYDHKGWTPLSGVMYEAALYYRGEDMFFGDITEPNTSTNDSRVGGSGTKYKSPMEASCQKNHIILLTDGEPYGDVQANPKIRSLISDIDNLPPGLSKTCGDTDEDNPANGPDNGDCLDELAYWLQNTDHSDTLSQGQEITVHTIGGFDLTDGVALLQNTAAKGGGAYYPADDSQELIAALDSIFLKILASDSTFTAPAVSVNAFNTSEHRDELFYALFRPDDTIKWKGNLKKYKLSDNGIVLSKGGVDAAISETTGFFTESSEDFWNESDDPDGKDVGLGGMANLLDYNARSIYTETSSTKSPLVALRGNATVSSFGATDSDELNDLVDWAYGKDIIGSGTGNRFSIGDPLHSEPVIVTYGGDDANPDSTIFFGTNEGYIHAVDTVTGQEEFAFLPQALHSNQKLYLENGIAASSKPYGMDGSITTWFYDAVADNNVLDSGEHVYLYSGMRRGGRNYYGLNVTDRSNPKLLFRIEGGTNTVNGEFTNDFRKLGQTWSRMEVAKVRYKGEDIGYGENVRIVLFFSGGYDENQDSNTSTADDGMGNAVYMVDATTGNLLWFASDDSSANLEIDEMSYSMPASPSLVDHDGDGFVDYFFTADMGGQVFRFDIDQENDGKSNFAEGGVIASIADSDLAGKRRFYNKPNISLVKDSQYGDYLTIALGSGHRAHPKNTTEVENRFYVIKDHNPYSKPTSYEIKTEAPTSKLKLDENENPSSLKLYNATDVMTGGKSTLESEAYNDLRIMLNNGGGFYVTLSSDGEKVLSEAVTFSGAIIFTTFKPSSTTNSANSCGANTGEARLYAIDQRTGIPILNLDNDPEGEDEASTLLTHSGIAPRPVIIYREGGGKTIAVGTEAINDSRFEPVDPEDCPDGETCEIEESKCESNNCYVTPLYWRQNNKN